MNRIPPIDPDRLSSLDGRPFEIARLFGALRRQPYQNAGDSSICGLLRQVNAAIGLRS